ncbi:hypothetical protein D3C79_585130 [compost metagenome]
MIVAVVASGQHQDRQALRLLAQQAAHLQTVKTRQHQVEDDQVRLLPAELIEHMVTTGYHPHVEIIALQVTGDQLGQGTVVFDQK